MAARDFAHVAAPLGAIQALQAKGVLPVLKQDVAGFNKSYLFSGIAAPTIAGAEQQIIAKGGLPTVLTVKPQKTSLLQDIFSVLGFFGGAVSGSGTGLVSTALSTPNTFTPVLGAGFQQTAGGSMGLFDSIFGNSSSDTTGSTGGGFSFGQGIDWTGLLNTVTPLATNFISSGFGGNQAAPQAALAGAVPAVVTGGAVAVARGFATRFPNLGAALARFRAAGQKVSRAKLYAMMKRFGPAFLVNGGLLTAAAVNELALAGPGRRRMNPANSRALSRAARRIRSFHKLCRHTDLLRSHGRRTFAKRS